MVVTVGFCELCGIPFGSEEGRVVMRVTTEKNGESEEVIATEVCAGCGIEAVKRIYEGRRK